MNIIKNVLIQIVTVLLSIIVVLPASAEPVTAVRADDFVESMGICATFGHNYGVEDQIVYAGLQELGIRYIRGWMNYLDASAAQRSVEEFKDLGVRMVGLWKDDKLNKVAECVPEIITVGPDFFIAIEGHNEPDIFSKTSTYNGFANNAADDQWNASVHYHNDLYARIKSDPATRHLPVVVPSIAKTKRIEEFDVMDHDLRNLHYYPHGWGADREATYPTSGSFWAGRSFQEHIEDLADYQSDHPIYMTEMGINPAQSSYWAQATYIARYYAEFFKNVPGGDKLKTFFFRLNETKAAGGHKGWGLIDEEDVRHDGFYALKAFIDLLSEATYDPMTAVWQRPNEGMTPAAINIAYQDKLETTHDLLLQKGDGVFYLLIWQEVNSWDWTSRKALHPADDRLTITVAEGINTASQFKYDPQWNYLESSLNIDGGDSVTIDVPDEVMVVRFTTSPENSLEGTYFLKNKDSRRRMRPDDGGSAVGIGIEQQEMNNGAAEYQWHISQVPSDPDYYYITNAASGLKIRPDNCADKPGAIIETHDGSGNCVKWRIKAVAGDAGKYFLVNKKGHQIKMKNDGCSNAAGTRIVTHDGTGNCVRWMLEPVATSLGLK